MHKTKKWQLSQTPGAETVRKSSLYPKINGVDLAMQLILTAEAHFFKSWPVEMLSWVNNDVFILYFRPRIIDPGKFCDIVIWRDVEFPGNNNFELAAHMDGHSLRASGKMQPKLADDLIQTLFRSKVYIAAGGCLQELYVRRIEYCSGIPAGGANRDDPYPRGSFQIDGRLIGERLPMVGA